MTDSYLKNTETPTPFSDTYFCTSGFEEWLRTILVWKMAPACGGIFPWKNIPNCWQLHNSQEKRPSSTCMPKSEKPFRPRGKPSWEGSMTTLTGGKYDIQPEKKKSLYYEKSHLPLSSHSRSCIQSKLSHHALLQVFLFPLGHVSFQSKNPFFFLTQEFHKRRGVVLRDVGSLRCTLTLMSKIKKKEVSRCICKPQDWFV